MNNIFTGALSYADDITLLCPSIYVVLRIRIRMILFRKYKCK